MAVDIMASDIATCGALSVKMTRVDVYVETLCIFSSVESSAETCS